MVSSEGNTQTQLNQITRSSGATGSDHHQFFCSRKLSLCFLLCLAVILVLIIQMMWYLWVLPFSSSSNGRSWVFNNYTSDNQVMMIGRLRESVTFLPLKDLRFEKTAMEGHTWFMSSLNDTVEAAGEPEFIRFPSEASKGRLLCLKGRSHNDGGKNSYALAWRDALPSGSTLLAGLTFVSDAYYDYGNLWHGLTAALPFAWWRLMIMNRNRCGGGGAVSPARWVLYRWGELRLHMGLWVEKLMEAAFDGVPINVESLEQYSAAVCFEEALVHRHTGGNMGLEERKKVFEMLRCKARAFCSTKRYDDVDRRSPAPAPAVRLTMLLRKGARAFKNESVVVGVFERACREVGGCVFATAHSDELDFCEQVRLMSSTDVVASPHGAQLTNMIFMEQGSSVMEFFPRGWLELAGVGQYVHHWLAKWSGMRHQGAWRDDRGGDQCPYQTHKSAPDRRCYDFYKSSKIGHNETYFAEWAIQVLINHVKLRKKNIIEAAADRQQSTTECACTA